MKGRANFQGYRFGVVLPVFLALVLVGGASDLFAQRALSKLASRAARMADDIPLKNADAISDYIRRSSESVDDVLKRDFPDVLKVMDRSNAIRKALGNLVDESSDPSVRRLLGELDDIDTESALLTCSGSKRLADKVGDFSLRDRLMREGGAETLAAIGKHDDLVDDWLRFSAAIDAKKLPSPPGMRQISAEDFGKFFLSQGDRAKTFWDTYVKPHWQVWLGSAALAAVILAPDDFIDAAGHLTQRGFERIGELGGAALAGAIKGSGEVAKQAVEEVARTYMTSVAGWVSLAIIVLAMVIVFSPARIALFKFLGRLASRKPRGRR